MGSKDVDLDKEVFTTFDVANICNANITSIKNWIEQGELQAHRTPGGHYRIKRKILQDFLNRHGMPNPFTERERKHILVINQDVGLKQRLRDQFGDIHRYLHIGELVEGLLKIGEWRPDAVVLDTLEIEVEPERICRAVGNILELRPVHLVVIHDGGEEEAERLRSSGAHFVVDVSEGEAGIYEAVRRAML